jgi:phospholipase C
MKNQRLNIILLSLVFFQANLYSMGILIPTEKKPSCDRSAGSRPFPNIPAGSKNPKIPLEHLVVIMQENHSFDQYYGRLNQDKFYGKYVDGVKDSFYNWDWKLKKHYSHHSTTLCLKNPGHSYPEMNMAWDKGMMGGFVKFPGAGDISNPGFVMAYFDERDLPFYYSLANNFAIADRYFSSMIGPTHPNRLYLLSASNHGTIDNNPRNLKYKNIFQLLNEYKISWKYYRDKEGYLFLFQPFYDQNQAHVGTTADYINDLKNNTLPTVAFIDAPWDYTDEHPAGGNIQKGQVWAADMIVRLMASDSWKTSALFLTYDEGGGYYDHVPPPLACKPDDKLNPGPWQPDRLGFRVPFTAVSPYVKRHYVSHTVYDHTSVLKFIETWWNLPALTKRDANANDLLDMFDFSKPKFTSPIPYLIRPTVDPVRDCDIK